MRTEGGDIVKFLEDEHFRTPAARIQHDSEEVYAPFVAKIEDKLQEQAMKVRKSLESFKATSATDDQWPSKFWKSISSIEVVRPALAALLQDYGYTGRSSTSAPRTEELVRDLKS